MYLGAPYPNTTIQDAVDKIIGDAPIEGDTLGELYALLNNAAGNNIKIYDSLSLFPVVGDITKLYIAKDFIESYIWDAVNNVYVTKDPIIKIYDSLSLFPVVGDITKLYIAKDAAKSYVWDAISNTYKTKMNTDEINLSFNVSENMYTTFNTILWSAGPQFIFKGSQFLDLIDEIKIASYISIFKIPALYDIRIFDNTNNFVIAEFLGLTNEIESIFSTNVINNIPVGEAIFQVQGRVYDVRNQIRLSSLSIGFKG